jgi:hypothetical protein
MRAALGFSPHSWVFFCLALDRIAAHSSGDTVLILSAGRKPIVSMYKIVISKQQSKRKGRKRLTQVKDQARMVGF